VGKKQNFLPDIPKWELKTDFDPLSVNRRVCGNFVNYRGVISQPSTPLCNKIWSYPDLSSRQDIISPLLTNRRISFEVSKEKGLSTIHKFINLSLWHNLG
jgi:hypothetical protein